MKIKSIEIIPGAGINVMHVRQRTLYDADGRPVVIDEQEQPSAIGINDFAADPENPTPHEQEIAKQKIAERLREVLPPADADALANASVLQTRLNNEIAGRLRAEALQTELASALERERAEKRDLELQVESVRRDLETAREQARQLLQQSQQANDQRGVDRGQ